MSEIPKDVILSPADTGISVKEIGLYPDRLFCKDFQNSIKWIVDRVREQYAKEIAVDADYFKIYAVEIEAKKDGDAIAELNKRLDYLELHNIALSDKAEKSIIDLIGKKENSPLFPIAFGSNKFGLKYEKLSEIASAQLEQMNGVLYNEILKKANETENETGKDELIKMLSKDFTKFITPHKYICVVHADGDNVGTIVSTLGNGELTPFSNKLLNFGKKACLSIKAFQGFPIYAGGDDLLFIAPVVSNNKDGNTQTIFDLIEQINADFKEAKVHETTGKDGNGKDVIPSMSYGISITYHKYPLYEALKMSREQLFDIAKKIKDKNTDKKIKNAVAWTLQKGSGSAVSGVFSENNKDVANAFHSLINSINSKIDNNLVSAVAHKIKANEYLLKLFMGKKDQSVRLDAFFDKILEFKDKKVNEKNYLMAVKELLIALYPKTNDIEDTIKTIYAMLRTAKFIKGLEDDKDE
jgi:CRISPR-associated protein Cmr2